MYLNVVVLKKKKTEKIVKKNIKKKRKKFRYYVLLIRIYEVLWRLDEKLMRYSYFLMNLLCIASLCFS